MVNGALFDVYFLALAGAIALVILVARALRHRRRRPWWRADERG